MLRYLILFSSIFVISDFMSIINPGPKYPPTKGEVWPKPQQEVKGAHYFKLNPGQFQIKVTNYICSTLIKAIKRYVHLTKQLYKMVQKLRMQHRPFNVTTKQPVKDYNCLGELRQLDINLSYPCEEYPQFDMEESYNLSVSAMSQLESTSIWGILWGLETFSQLFYFSDTYDDIYINMTHISDWPRHPHRGLLLDTSRHYLTVGGIMRTLDAMAYNKLNVFHWHIVDDQSFPYQSMRFPALSARGAYHPTAVYTPKDILHVVRYARDRGIRVIPEFDVPGHTRSWGVAYPNLLTKCYCGGGVVGLGPMNPISDCVYKILRDLFGELKHLFPERYLHIGGDEVDLDCWASNPDLVRYMMINNMSSTKELHALFMKRTIALLSKNTKPVVWQEVFDEDVPLPLGTLVQMWFSKTQEDMVKILNAGHHILYSSCWYLDHLKSGGDWEEFYDCDPRAILNNTDLEGNLVGGEACMWGEVVDDRNLASRIWPRASGVAERLWSAPGGLSDDARNRMEEHACRLVRRGVNAEPPNGPGFCLT